MNGRGVLSSLLDCIYPHLEGSRFTRALVEERRWRRLAKEDDHAIATLGSDVEQLGYYSSEVGKLLDREQSRRQSVEGRLTSIVGLTSIAATIVIGILAALAAGTLSVLPGLATVLFAVGGLYLVLQLCIALLASVDGLSRAGQLEETASDLFESRASAPPVRLRRDIARKLERLRDFRRGMDMRVSRMAVAHQAIRNFLVGLLLLAIVAAWFAITRSPSSPPIADRRSATEVPRDQVSAPNPGVLASATHGMPSEPLDGGLTTSLLMMAGGLALIVVGAVLTGAGWKTGNIKAGAALMASGALLSLLGGSKFQFEIGKFDKLIGELRLELFKPSSPPAQLRPALVRVATIGPFPEGEHELLGRQKIRECLKVVMTRDFTRTVGGWQIVGRVDKRQLKPDRALLYGSNQALAMSRATWVRDSVLSEIPEAAVAQSMVFVGGAQHVGNAVSAAKMEVDRGVDIYALVAESSGEMPASPAMPHMPLLCP